MEEEMVLFEVGIPTDLLAALMEEYDLISDLLAVHLLLETGSKEISFDGEFLVKRKE